MKKQELIENVHYYIQDNSKWVFTEIYHLTRGYCCNNNCRHCPYKTTNMDQVMRQMTFGEKLVGLTFNPSGDQKVQRAKELCAELADLLNDHNSSVESTQFSQRLFSHAVGEILNAQMNVVKVLTLKY